MKKISLLTLACAAAVSVMAQDGTQGSDRDHKPLRTEMSRAVRFGLQGGLSLAKWQLKNIPDVSTTMKTGFYGGAFVNIPLGIFRIQPGVIWNSIGTKYSIGSGAGAQKVEQDLHYITVPVTFQLVPGHNGFFIEAGPQLGYLITAKAEDQTSGSNGEQVSNKSEFDRTDFGAHGGIGYITRIGLGVTARYMVGFTNLNKDDNSASNSGEKAQNRAWQFGLVYHFGAAK